MSLLQHLVRTASLKERGKADESRPLASWRSLDAYVLLGEPGSGKTTVFKQEAELMGSDALFMTAKDFLTLFQADQWHGQTLFIDALDERRSTMGSSSAPLELLRAKLLAIGKPRFRVSCREADWLAGGADDLIPVSPNKSVAQLRLDPLDDAGILLLLEAWLPPGGGEATEFIDAAGRHNLTAQLHSPLLLKLLVGAVKGNQWPDSRHAVFEIACSHMAAEYDDARRRASTQPTIPKDQLLDVAGKLFAVLLLSDSQWLTLDPGDRAEGCIFVSDIPAALEINPSVREAALASKLFSAEGERRGPWHRTVAEYLGARAIAKIVIDGGLPIQRVLSLMTTDEGFIFEALRGLYGWLAFHCTTDRDLLIKSDSLGLILYGDVREFSTTQKTLLLDALREEALEFPWFRTDHWDRRPFGALGTVDMIPEFQRLLEAPERDFRHGAHLECVIDAVIHGVDMPALAPTLYANLVDQSHSKRVRRDCAVAWAKCVSFGRLAVKSTLQDLTSGVISDDDDEICGRLLNCVYPAHLSAPDALRCLHPRKDTSLIGWYHMFWASEFVEKIPASQLADAIDSILALVSKPEVSDDDHTAFGKFEEIRRIAMRLLVKALEKVGNTSTDEILYRWLRLGLNKYGSVDSNSEEVQKVRKWLSAHPARIKAVFKHAATNPHFGIERTRSQPWMLEQSLYGAELPRDWYRWLLKLTVACKEEAFVKRWVIDATHAAVHNRGAFDIRLEDIEDWATLNSRKWPAANAWIEEVTCC